MTNDKDFVIEGDTLVKYTGNAAEVVVPECVRVIGERAFYENHDIIAVDLNETVTVMDYAFYFCKNLRSVKADKIKTVGHSAFRQSWIIENIDLCSVERIEDYAFHGCMYIKEIGSTPDLVYIGEHAFDGTDLERIEMSKNATRVGASAFSCSELIEFDYPDGIETVEFGVFSSCDRLKRISLPKSLKKISMSAFWYCDRLRRVEIPEGVTEIEYSAFEGCSIAEVYNKSALEIRAGRAKPGGSVAEHAVNVFTPTNGRDTREEIDGFVFCTDSVGDKGTYLIEYSGDKKDLVLPRDYHGGGYGIYRMAFCGSDMESIDMGDGVTEICNLAFYECENLRSVKFGKGLKYIYRLAFKKCEKLTQADLGDSVELLGTGAFLATDLHYIAFGAGMKEIRSCAFKYCGRLNKIYYRGTPEQFAAIRLGGRYRDWFNRSVRYYSQTEKPNCWHYEDGKIVEY